MTHSRVRYYVEIGGKLCLESDTWAEAHHKLVDENKFNPTERPKEAGGGSYENQYDKPVGSVVIRAAIVERVVYGSIDATLAAIEEERERERAAKTAA